MYLAPVRPPNQRLPNRVYATRRVVAAVAVVAMLFLLYTVVTAVVRRAGSVDTSRSDRPEHLAGARRRWWRTADRGVNVDVHHGAQAEGEDRAVGGQPGGAVRRRRQRRRHVRARTSTN